jgi:hypothetical protein
VSEAHEVIFKIIAIFVALVGLWLVKRSDWARVGPRQNIILASLAALGAAGYINFGRFHTDGSWLHIYDQYHYVIGSKYFPEVGYDGLYAATLLAYKENDPTFVPPARVRDLSTREKVSISSLDGFMHVVRARFTDARWMSFRSDVTHFNIPIQVFHDVGYNPPPSHVAIERLFTSHLPFRVLTAAFFASLDFMLLASAGFVIYRVFGLETLAATSLMFGLGACSRYFWVGGAFLRQDWLVALILCAAALRRGHAQLAGVALAYAAGARVFPVLMLLPLTFFAISNRHSETPLPIARFAIGFIGTSIVLFLMGCLAGRGAGAWLESAQRLMIHSSNILPNSIGLRVPFGSSLAAIRGDLVDLNTDDNLTAIAADFTRTVRHRIVLIAISTALLIGLLLRLAWYSRDAVIAFVAGVGVIFALTIASCYYGSYFVLLGLVRPTRSAAVFLVANAMMYVTGVALLALFKLGLIHVNGAALYAPVSALLLIVVVYWMFMLDKRYFDAASAAQSL